MVKKNSHLIRNDQIKIKQVELPIFILANSLKTHHFDV